MIPQYYEFINRTKILSGYRALEKIPSELNEMGKTRSLIVCQKEYIDKGTQKMFMRAMEGAELVQAKLFLFCRPIDDECVQEGLSEYKSQDCDSIITLGDGSAFELGNCIKNKLQLEMGVDKRIPFIAVPTASSGAEITGEPDLIVLDPKLTLNLSLRDTVLSALDTLCHSIEAYTSLKKNPVSDAYALSAIKLAAESLPAIIKKSRNNKAKYGLSNGALLSGIGFNNSKGGISHAIAKGLTECCRVSHAEAISVILPHCLQHNMIKNDEYYGELLLPLKGPEVYSETPLHERGRKFQKAIRNMILEFHVKLDIPVCLSEIGVKRTDFERITDTCLKDEHLVNHSEEVNKEDIINILNLAY
ncbi:MAG: iron-containing alcohol dehydrogenase [Clostridiaceae bacterium]|nr:iron-containing alcohol dehydrogenase [Clostridiaceae bacterium]